jgi:L-malate glycosyltransferase
MLRVMKKVLIIYRFLPQYRVEFYNGLKKALVEKNIELQLIYGKTSKVEALRNDEVDIDWAQYIPNRTLKLGKIELIWQPCLKNIKGKDLIIVEGANKLILNYILMFARHFSRFSLGIWGHGRNMQIAKNSIRNRFKYLFLNKCDCYFAYTKGVKDLLLMQNFPENKVVIVQNAIAIGETRDYYINISDLEVKDLKNQLGIEGSNVGIFCGGMYPEKRIDFILKVICKVRKEIPDFHMIFIGSGIDSDKVKNASENNDWIHYVGTKFGKDRVKYFKMSAIQLMPGLVGLGVLDSFVMETPMLTTDYPYHSPEIEYLGNGINGIITRNNLDNYTDMVIEVFKSKKYLELIDGCKESAKKYTVENMVKNFTDGIIKCISKEYLL